VISLQQKMVISEVSFGDGKEWGRTVRLAKRPR
jgi:hypothetical protein